MPQNQAKTVGPQHLAGREDGFLGGPHISLAAKLDSLACKRIRDNRPDLPIRTSLGKRCHKPLIMVAKATCTAGNLLDLHGRERPFPHAVKLVECREHDPPKWADVQAHANGVSRHKNFGLATPE